MALSWSSSMPPGFRSGSAACISMICISARLMPAARLELVGEVDTSAHGSSVFRGRWISRGNTAQHAGLFRRGFKCLPPALASAKSSNRVLLTFRQLDPRLPLRPCLDLLDCNLGLDHGYDRWRSHCPPKPHHGAQSTKNGAATNAAPNSRMKMNNRRPGKRALQRSRQGSASKAFLISAS